MFVITWFIARAKRTVLNILTTETRLLMHSAVHMYCERYYTKCTV
uniref:Uncharacterized protein n=1 Tax=Anguilla anguilla TaxID=7936 RepID=A0A0E9WF09_ANGAN